MLAQQCDLKVGDFIWVGGDCHLYLNHLDQVALQLERRPLPLPVLRLKRRPPSLFDYEFADFEVDGYEHHPAIKAPIAV
jgi:thymidylate synthase